MNLLKKRILNAPVYGWLVVLGADCFLLITLMFFNSIRNIVIKYNPVCLLYSMGFRCGLCGGTRCLTALSQGDFILALKYNCFIVFLIFFSLILLILAHLSLFLKSQKIRAFVKKTCSVKGLIILMLSWLAFMVLRNIVLIAEKLII